MDWPEELFRFVSLSPADSAQLIIAGWKQAGVVVLLPAAGIVLMA